MRLLSSFLWDAVPLFVDAVAALLFDPACSVKKVVHQKRSQMVLIVPGGMWQNAKDDKAYTALYRALSSMGYPVAVATYPRMAGPAIPGVIIQTLALLVPLFLAAVLIYTLGVPPYIASVIVSFVYVFVYSRVVYKFLSSASARKCITVDDQIQAVFLSVTQLAAQNPGCELVVVAHECGVYLAMRAMPIKYKLVALSGIFDLEKANSVGDLWRAPHEIRCVYTRVKPALPAVCTKAWAVTGRLCAATRQMQADEFACTHPNVTRVTNCGFGSGVLSAINNHTLLLLLAVLNKPD